LGKDLLEGHGVLSLTHPRSEGDESQTNRRGAKRKAAAVAVSRTRSEAETRRQQLDAPRPAVRMADVPTSESEDGAVDGDETRKCRCGGVRQ
jgi:hypothetical protein